MVLVSSFRALVTGLLAPWKSQPISGQTIVSVFAISILLVTTAQLVLQGWEGASAQLVAQANQMRFPVDTSQLSGKDAQGLNLNMPQRVFTAQLGITLMQSILQAVILAGLVFVVIRFLTNTALSYAQSISAVASTALIEVVRALLYAGVHVGTGTMRWGVHAGIFTDPVSSPLLFAWLAKIDIITAWQYIAVSMIACRSVSLHYRFGIVTGIVVFVISIILFGGMALVGWFSQLSIQAATP